MINATPVRPLSTTTPSLGTPTQAALTTPTVPSTAAAPATPPSPPASPPPAVPPAATTTTPSGPPPNKKPKGKFNLKLILGAIGFLIVAVGAVAGFYLVQQNQEIRQQAAVTSNINDELVVTSEMATACRDKCQEGGNCQLYVMRYTCASNNPSGGCQENREVITVEGTPRYTFNKSKTCGIQQIDVGCKDSLGTYGSVAWMSYIGPTSCQGAEEPDDDQSAEPTCVSPNRCVNMGDSSAATVCGINGMEPEASYTCGTGQTCCKPSTYVPKCAWDSSGAGRTCVGDGIYAPQGKCSNDNSKNCTLDSHCNGGSCQGFVPCCPGLTGLPDGVCKCAPASPVPPTPPPTPPPSPECGQPCGTSRGLCKNTNGNGSTCVFTSGVACTGEGQSTYCVGMTNWQVSNPNYAFNFCGNAGSGNSYLTRKSDNKTSGFTQAEIQSTCAACGDGILHLGEECDEGAKNGTATSTCDASCKRKVIVTYSCNSACTTDAQCQTSNQGYICDPSARKCRLASNPTSTSCAPLAPAACLNLTLRVNSQDRAVGAADPVRGDIVNIVCAQAPRASRYIFRITEPNGQLVTLSSLDNTNISQPYYLTKSGDFKAQCQICLNADDSSCLPFE